MTQITAQETLKIDATFDPTMFIITSSLGQRIVQVEWPFEPNAESSSETIQQPPRITNNTNSQPQRNSQRVLDGNGQTF